MLGRRSACLPPNHMFNNPQERVGAHGTRALNSGVALRFKSAGGENVPTAIRWSSLLYVR